MSFCNLLWTGVRTQKLQAEDTQAQHVHIHHGMNRVAQCQPHNSAECQQETKSPATGLIAMGESHLTAVQLKDCQLQLPMLHAKPWLPCLGDLEEHVTNIFQLFRASSADLFGIISYTPHCRLAYGGQQGHLKDISKFLWLRVVMSNLACFS